MRNLFASKVRYIARRVPCRCCHVHGVHCDCYRHRVVALHIATTAMVMVMIMMSLIMIAVVVMMMMMMTVMVINVCI